MKFTNNEDIGLSLAVWLATDTYNYNYDPKYISATTLLKSIRQIVLGSRITATTGLQDIAINIQSQMGTALHSAIESAWKTNYKTALIDLGYPPGITDNIVLNPKSNQLTDKTIAVYTELRTEKAINNYIISGQFDFVLDGVLEDFKSMGVFGFIKNTNTEKFRLQGSIYRWLNPQIITANYMYIQYLFTDWSKLRATIEAAKGYPASRIEKKKLTLLSIPETENFINQKLNNIKLYEDTPEVDLPPCNQEELWQDDPIYAYYKNPNKTTRSTANFANYHEAHAKLIEDGNVGIIINRLGTVKACNYCNAYNLCTQKDEYITNGLLKEG